MRIDIITLFPEFFDSLKNHSIVGRAVGAGKVEIVTHNLRDWSKDNYKSVDDSPYGGGPGMVLKVDVVVPTIESVKKLNPGAQVWLTTPQGELYHQKTARALAQVSGIIIVCGHYEGFDERIRSYADREVSIGDYVLTGGEPATVVIIDSVVRLIPGVLGDDSSSADESHTPSIDSDQAGLLEYPQYTRPEVYEDQKVPEILLSGNHAEINKWRSAQALARTKKRRPDLLKE